MQSWLKISLLLCVFGFLKEVRPSEPFIYDFLIGPWRNLTNTQVSQEVYPVGTYSNMLLLIIVFLITDLLRYKPIIIVLGLSGIVIWSLLLWTTSLLALQIVEVFYGAFMASEVAYYTYIYAKVDKEHYQQVTSHTRAAILAGRTISGITSQTLISLEVMDFRQLNYITFTAMILATIWGIFLPSVKQSVYFHQENLTNRTTAGFILMKNHLIGAYSNKYVLKWSLWWALSTCGYVQIENYMQPLYEQILHDTSQPVYNGAVEAILTLTGFSAAMLAGFLKINWQIKGEITLTIFALIQGAFMLVSSQTESIFVCYTLYILFGILYYFMVTIASAQIALFIDEDSYGLIFGINSFLALVFNSILTAAVATKGIGFELYPRDQYIVYGCYHLVISVIFIGIGCKNWTEQRCQRTRSQTTD